MQTSTRTLSGTPVVPGTGCGRVVRTAPTPAPPQPRDVAEADRPREGERLAAAAVAVADRLSARASRASGVAAEVLLTTAGLARDRGLLRAAGTRVRTGVDAATAVVAAAEQFAGAFRAAGGLMAERVTDLLDVRDRLVAELTGAPEPGIPTPDEPSVLVADDLAPADTAGLDRPSSSPSSCGWAGRPATPRSSRVSSASPASSPARAPTPCRTVRWCSSTASPAPSCSTPTPWTPSGR